MHTSSDESGVKVAATDETQNISGFSKENTNSETATNIPKLTPTAQRKSDALDFAELIYKIYKDSCPVKAIGPIRKEKQNV